MNRLQLDDTRERLLGRCLRRQAERIPDDDFLVAGDAHLSYGRVNALANAYARGFRAAGVGRGDTVAFFTESAPEVVYSALGLNKLGAVWVPANTDYKGTWLREAATQRLQAERGLGPEITATLADLTRQLRGLGTNLNQVAHAANEGRPVTLDRKLAKDINDAINQARAVLNEIKSRLP